MSDNCFKKELYSAMKRIDKKNKSIVENTNIQYNTFENFLKCSYINDICIYPGKCMDCVIYKRCKLL